MPCVETVGAHAHTQGSRGGGEGGRWERERETEIHREIEIDRETESKIAKNAVMCPLRSLPLSCEIQHGSRSNWHS